MFSPSARLVGPVVAVVTAVVVAVVVVVAAAVVATVVVVEAAVVSSNWCHREHDCQCFHSCYLNGVSLLLLQCTVDGVVVDVVARVMLLQGTADGVVVVVVACIMKVIGCELSCC